MRTTNILTCDGITEAYIIKGRLNNEGIDCFLTNQNFTNLMPLYNNMLGAGIQVIINESDLTAAQEILKDKLEPNNNDLVCPHCRSSNIGLGIGDRKGLKLFNILIAILIWIPIGNLKPKYYCKDCKKEIIQ